MELFQYAGDESNCSGEKEQLPGQIQQFTGKRYLKEKKKGENSFPYINSVKIE